MITIDGQDIKAMWGLEPLKDGFYNAIMKDAGIKDRIVNDYPDEDGVEVSTEVSYTKSQEISLSFLCDTYAHYYTFLTYCVNTPSRIINMYVPLTGETLKLEYLACSTFNYYIKYNMFAVKFREANPTDR